MRIAFLTLGYTPSRMSGLDISGERLVRALLAAGHEVFVVAGQHTPAPELQAHPRLHIHRVSVGPTNWIGWAVRSAALLNRLNRQYHFDIVHFWDVHFAYAYRGQYVASAQHSFRQRLKSLDHMSPSWRQVASRNAYYRLALWAAETPSMHRASGLLAGSAATRDEIIGNYGVLPERIMLARHGIDTDFFRPVDAKSLRSDLGISPQEPVILFAGFITPRKGMKHLAAALARMRPTPRLVVVGRWDAASRERFMKLLGPISRNVIYAGFVPDQQMPCFYSMADVYVSASLLEGFGLPLVESLACETPVVTTDSGAAAEVVGPGGLVVPPGDDEALSDAVSDLLMAPERRNQLGRLGREHVVSHFTLQQMLDDTIAAYHTFGAGHC